MPNLTPFSYGLIALVCLLGIAHQWSEDAFPWWRLALAAYLVSLVYEWSRVRTTSIAARLISDPRLRLGRLTDLLIEFENLTAGTERVKFAADLPAILEASRAERTVLLESGQQTPVKLPVRAVEIGAARIDQLPARVLGPLGLGWWKRSISFPAAIEIVPDSLTRIEQSSGLASTGLTAQQRQGSGQELHHLREYRPGDPRHTIDWKATAKSGRLVTRVFGEDQHLDIVLIVDAGRTSRNRIDGLSQLGHYINLGARFAEQAVANEDQIGLIAVTDRPVAVVPPGRGIDAVTRIRHELARLETQPVESDLLSAAREMSRFVRHRCLILVLTDLYGAAATGRLSQSVRLWSGQHLPIVVGLVGREMQQLKTQSAHDWLDPYVSLAAQNYAEDLYRGMQGLRKLGAQTLLSRPRDLEHSVFRHYHQLKLQRRI